MNGQKQFEHIRNYRLVGIFACSLMLSISYGYRILYFMNHLHASFPYENAFLIGNSTLIIIMLILALWRYPLAIIKLIPALWKYIRLGRFPKSEPSMRAALEDEQISFNWLRAYRVAFFVLFITQLLGKSFMIIWRCPLDIPYQSELSLSVAVMTTIGAFCIYSFFGRKRHG